MDEIRDDVAVLDTPQDITHEMTSTQVPRRIRFIGLGETYEALPEGLNQIPTLMKRQ